MAKAKLGELIDKLYAARAERLEFQRDMDESLEKLKETERAIEDKILAEFDKQEIEGARGSTATASVSRLVVPSVKDWPQVYDYIKKTGAWDLLEKRMARVAYRDRLEAGEAVPGTEPFTKITLNLTKLTKEK